MNLPIERKHFLKIKNQKDEDLPFLKKESPFLDQGEPIPGVGTVYYSLDLWDNKC
jgi:hypothetical protein